MKTDKGYRFNIGFPSNTAERVRVGEFLESCGNRKGTVVVEALSLLLEAHPGLAEVTGTSQPLHLTVKQSLTREEIESIVRDTVRSMGGIVAAPPVASGEIDDAAGYDPQEDEFVSKMVDSFDELFN